jgi:hypothetical protein
LRVFMKIESKEKRILEKAKVFKSRASKSPDNKRHDLPKPDEVKQFYIAYTDLGWSYRKIASVFNRDPRTVKEHIEKSKTIRELSHKQKEKLVKHFDELADVAKALVLYRQVLLSSPIPMRESLPYALRKYTIGYSVFVGSNFMFMPPEDFTPHFIQEFSEFDSLSLSSVTSFPPEVIERLVFLGKTAKFRFCPACPTCKEIVEKSSFHKQLR